MSSTHILIITWGRHCIERPITVSRGQSPEEAAQKMVDDLQAIRNQENPEKPLLVTGKLFAYCGDFLGSASAEAVLPTITSAAVKAVPVRLQKDAKFII